MRVSLASILFACTLMASAGTARAANDGGDDGGQGGSSASGSGGADGGGGAPPTGIQPTTTPDNLGCSTSGAASGTSAPLGLVALVIAGVALARRRREGGEEGVR